METPPHKPGPPTGLRGRARTRTERRADPLRGRAMMKLRTDFVLVLILITMIFTYAVVFQEIDIFAVSAEFYNSGSHATHFNKVLNLFLGNETIENHFSISNISEIRDNTDIIVSTESADSFGSTESIVVSFVVVAVCFAIF